MGVDVCTVSVECEFCKRVDGGQLSDLRDRGWFFVVSAWPSRRDECHGPYVEEWRCWCPGCVRRSDGSGCE